MLGGNISKFKEGVTSEETEAKETSLKYSQQNVWVEVTEMGSSARIEKARNWLDGIYGDTETKIKYPVFTGTTYSMNYINHNDSFLVAKEISANGNPYNLPTTADSHLMKDSEWGAVAYLGQSKYGLEDKKICVNNITLDSGGKARTATEGKTGIDSVYAVTGLTSELETNNIGENSKTLIEEINKIEGDMPTNTGGVHTWNQKSGQGASSSGTIYGIYDLSGGVWERTAAYTANDNKNLTTFGKSLLYNASQTNETNTKYTTVYVHNSTDDKNGGGLNAACGSNYNMAVNKRKFGNAMHETSTGGIFSTSWRGELSNFVGLDFPFSVRGDAWSSKSNAGLFCFNHTDGNSHCAYGFRAVLVGA